MTVLERGEVRLLRHAATLDRRVDGSVELPERVGEAFRMPGRQPGALGRVRREQLRGPQQRLVRPSAVAEPELLVALAVPGERAPRAVELEPQRVPAAGAHLRDHQRPARAVVEPQQDVGQILGLHRRVDPLDVLCGGERLDLSGRAPAHRDDSRKVGAELDDAQAGDELGEIEPVRADVADRAQGTALVGLEAPVPVGRQCEPVLQIAAVEVPDAAEHAVAHECSRVVDHRVEADVEVGAVHATARAGELEQLAGLVARRGEGLLADDVLARCEDGFDLRVMQVVRRGHVDDVDVVGEKRVEALVRGCERLGARALRRRADDAPHLDAEAAEGVDVERGDESRAHDAGGRVPARAHRRGAHSLLPGTR